MTEEMFGGQHRIDELTQAEQTVRVNTDETTGTVSNKCAHLRECTGVQKERKNQKKRLLTRAGVVRDGLLPNFLKNLKPFSR
jgi:hypothetical protein